MTEKAIKQEFEEFAYMVAHDLNKPVRHIGQFTQYLAEDLRGRLSAEERENLEIILQSTSQLQNMIGALRTFSRIWTRDKNLVSVNLSDLLARVINSLADDIGAAKAKFELSTLPDVFGDQDQLFYVLRAILGNAIKFRADGMPCIISVTHDCVGEFHRISVTDNGIGIEPHKVDAAFQFFHRLDPQNYPGLGVGLTISQKIIETHGGKIEIEPGEQGVAVQILLPRSGGEVHSEV